MKVCISIAVSRPEGQLAPLPGAIEASRDFVKWANAAKFDKVLAVTDEAGWPVTVAGLRAAFKDAIGNSANVVDHLVVHFAGHGFTDDIDDQLVLLTNWQRETTEAINVRRFVRLLEYYQPTRVSLFFDACRSEKPKDADQLQGSGVLERPKHDEPVEFLEGRFRPAAARAESYMLPGHNGEPPRCVFSTVLLKALGGGFPEALEDRGPGKAVTSDGLYRALSKALKDAAKRYKLHLKPSLRPQFVPPDDIYARMPIMFTPPELPEPPIEKASMPDYRQVRGDLTDLASKKRVREYRRDYESEHRPRHYETGAGLAVVGGTTRGKPAISPTAEARCDNNSADSATWWRSGAFAGAQQPLIQSSSLLVELENGGLGRRCRVPSTDSYHQHS